MNRLAGETSPYLRQHADNPVDWYPWGDEAFEKARAEDKPVLLSVGYSSCHWCHVMAHESFEDAQVAEAMNRLFVNVKVDREERPDLDQIYQAAHHMLSNRAGGWPLTMFLSPDGTPFFGGTYFPKDTRYGLPGFPRKIGAAEKGPLVVVCQKHGERPAARALRQHLLRDLVDAVDVGPLLTIDLDVDEQVIHDLCGLRILERLVRHDVAPVAGRVAHGQQDRFVFRTGPLEGRGAPWVPVDGVVRVLAEVWARFLRQAIGRSGGGSRVHKALGPVSSRMRRHYSPPLWLLMVLCHPRRG